MMGLDSDVFFAHTHEWRAWEPLQEHLEKVAALAAAFAATFASGQFGRVLGLWHDLGKYSREFQDYLRRDSEATQLDALGSVDHSTVGAKRIFDLAEKQLGTILAYCIAGHHAGLADWDEPGSRSCLKERLNKKVPPLSERAVIPEVKLPERPPAFDWGMTEANRGFRISVWCRMLFSALVDADCLATESFKNEAQAAQRSCTAPTFAELEARLTRCLEAKSAKDAERPVNRIRRQVLDACRAKAALAPGFFSLNVPTGGGKTLSSLAFALAHVRAHPQLRRVIYVIPYTSIIEQTAEEFRKALAPDSKQFVLEHHSNLDPDEETTWSRLASENWDAPLVVTTNVQFFESLYGNRTSACRKLHNIANSIVILDEAQMLSIGLLEPCLKMLGELVRNYGCSVVVCTATQPAIERRDDFAMGIENTRPIIDRPEALHDALKRVRATVLGKTDDDALARRLAEHASALCIVNTRPHARKLFEQLLAIAPQRHGEIFHLSALMCPQHRSHKIADIRERLANRLSTLVISTQLIEAGVDLDFPAVYRAIAGLDSIAQAAGRCNREGKLDRGKLFIFEPADQRMPSVLRHCADQTKQILPDYADDPLSAEAVRRYFELRYWQARSLDEEDVMKCFASLKAQFDFRTAAERFQWIKEAQVPVVVPFGHEGRRVCDRLRSARDRADHSLLLRAQRYTVHVHSRVIEALAVEPLNDRLWVLTNERDYDDLGLLLKTQQALDSEILVV